MTTAIDTTLDLAQREFKHYDLAAWERLDWYRRELRDASTIWAGMDITEWKTYVRTQLREAVAKRGRAKRYLREVEASHV